MNRIIRSTKFWLLAVVVTAVSAGAAYATIPGGDGVIHGCYAKSGGTLRVIDASVTKCKSGETALTWSQAGVPGPQGEQGEAGPPGPQGEPGIPGGLSGYETRGAASENSSAGFKSVTAECPAGKRAVGGGAETNASSEVALTSSTVRRSAGADTWSAIATEIDPTDTSWSLLVTVICANAA
jgi:hypothetical protein